MFKRAIHDLHPEIPNIDSRYDFTVGYQLGTYVLPVGQHYDVVIDMRRLRPVHTDN